VIGLLGVAGTISLALFGAGSWLLSRGRTPPPPGIRSESGRSPAEYAFRAQHAVFRRSGEVCVLVGVLNLFIALVLALIALVPES
jgi:uncharacterized membrane protein YphA (DoxX/SURF4 family)